MRTFVALCALLLCLTPVADAQSAAPSAPEIAAPEIAAPEIAAPEVAATVQRFYGGLTTLELGFTQSYWSDAYGRNLRTSAGTLRIRRPGRLRFDYTTPAGQVMTAVDDRVLHYEPGDDGEPGQYYRAETDLVSRAFGFLTGASRLEDDYRFAIVEGRRRIPDTVCLQLTPRRESPFAHVLLYVRTEGATAGVVSAVSIETLAGDWNNFRFPEAAMRIDPTFDAATFDYTPPAEAREITPPA